MSNFHSQKQSDIDPSLDVEMREPPHKSEAISSWLQHLSMHSIPFDFVLEELLIETQDRIGKLRAGGEGLGIQHQILVEESQLMTKLRVCAGGTSHEGRVIQALELHTHHMNTALEYLRLYLAEHPRALLAELPEVIQALSFDHRALLSELPIVNDLERFVSRTTLRETVLGVGESIADALNHYPAQISGLYQFPKIPELLIDSALESIRIFFEFDSDFPSRSQQDRIQEIALGIANAMHLQLKTFFARTCFAHDEVAYSPRIIDVPLTQTYLASERLLRFVRRISGGINSTSGSTNSTYEEQLELIQSDARDIRHNLKEIPFRPFLSQFTNDPETLYIALLDPSSRQSKAYMADDRFVLIPRTFSFGF